LKPTYTLRTADYAQGQVPPYGWEYHADDPKAGHGPPGWRKYAACDSVLIEEAWAAALVADEARAAVAAAAAAAAAAARHHRQRAWTPWRRPRRRLWAPQHQRRW
jgi:hypothetical protein